ncbi:hypothetical protein E2C01_022765 [Portunus trituberculatus]|uniref:Uncharacterized protein n=1 Tax=Portunus trituberculatus TaxID=210409 RepID=A0A5B7E8H5_PORTR|nr:hypothetical protein [Portunus trituberculatus]
MRVSRHRVCPAVMGTEILPLSHQQQCYSLTSEEEKVNWQSCRGRENTCRKRCSGAGGQEGHPGVIHSASPAAGIMCILQERPGETVRCAASGLTRRHSAGSLVTGAPVIRSRCFTTSTFEVLRGVFVI